MTTTEPEAWQRVCREGWLPLLSDAQLAGLREALARDDPKLLQRATTYPPPIQGCQDFPVEQACPFAYGTWLGGPGSVEAVEVVFGLTCGLVDKRLGEVAGCRHFLNWWDNTPRPEAVAGLLGEVRREQQRRAGA